MGILSGNPKDEPLHYGEIYNIWTFSAVAKGCVSFYQVYHNHAGDKDLKKLLKDLIDQAKQESKECDKILNDNGIIQPQVLPERPNVMLEDIPVGARLMDLEISDAISINLAVGLTTCSAIMASSIREDVGKLFASYHLTKAVLADRCLKLNKEKGWLAVPPLLIKRPETVKV
ncbi:MAG: DUF3231 family protein [Gorillibacterium sp.]|nr:DUF3231 family protein [Gorillibacterium sp.]